MKIEESKYIKLNHKKINFPFGTFYCFDAFLLAELNQGIHFNWERVKEVADSALNYYGENIKIAYISNRINSYSIEPQSWLKFEQKYNFFEATAIVVYDSKKGLSVELEKLFTKELIVIFKTLDEAINWALELKENKKVNL